MMRMIIGITHILIFIPLVLSIDSESAVKILNTLYEQISGDNIPLYTLIKTLRIEDPSISNQSEMILLLNNTYKGISLHGFELDYINPVQFRSHQEYDKIKDPLGNNFIQEALANYLDDENISLPSLETYKQNASGFILYKSEAKVKKKIYSIDILINSDDKEYFIKEKEIIEVYAIVLQEDSMRVIIIVSIISGLIFAFIGLCLFYKKYERLPFTGKDEARSNLNMDSVKAST
ncbi:hypothetical protein SteCoe_6975 [Stentor coeruleus]|uniref:FAS1 domain-containing protein n=1 Tax=Stentor coeruleus TaxID=5963 RepID=A0A1R2CNI4_9CILI|nr:hypothetical protein SteCoe_6975 [Stentor coeruleus]